MLLYAAVAVPGISPAGQPSVAMAVSWAVAGLAKVVCPQAYAHGEIVKLSGVGVGVAGG